MAVPVAAVDPYLTLVGWASALLAMCFNGSFGVPIKSETCRRLDIDPLVFQSYKTFMCLIFSWSVVLILGMPIQFSPWGIISGLFWVPNGVATIIAVKLAGLAVAYAVGCSLIALVSFTWGIFIFQESIHSKPVACLAVLLMILGFVGMSYFASQQQQQQQHQDKEKSLSSAGCVKDVGPPLPLLLTTTKASEDGFSLREPLLPPTTTSSSSDIQLIKPPKGVSSAGAKKQDDDNSSLDGSAATSVTSDRGSDDDSSSVPKAIDKKHNNRRRPKPGGYKLTIRNRKSTPVQHSVSSYLELESSLSCNELLVLPSLMREPLSSSQTAAGIIATSGTTTSMPLSGPNNNNNINKVLVVICGREVSNFKAGLIIATMGGLWGGSVMIPMKMCREDTKGFGYLISFSSGATMVTCVFWILRLLWNVGYHRSIQKGYQALPSFHLREMWLLGGMSGLLWSIGNLFGILSAHYLGAGVGYCVVQASMLVGGLWGILYFKEISGRAMIAKWILSALITISGIALLAYEKR